MYNVHRTNTHNEFFLEFLEKFAGIQTQLQDLTQSVISYVNLLDVLRVWKFQPSDSSYMT